MALARGTRLGPYQILAPIGAGGMGEVYRATDTRLERTVAIKVLPAHVASDPERKQRFEREAKTVAALSHPHICPVFDVGREGETDFLVMEYLEGETLADRLSKGALPLDQALRYAIEIADALDKAHRQGVTHRDLKPANIMLTKAGAKLLDFGLAKLKPTGPQSDASTKLADALTEQGTILGTFQYMAPEQLEGKDADARTDIWAFGCVVYEMVTGQKAFEGKSQASLIGAILHKEPATLSTVEPLSPAGLDYVAQTCLGKDPDDRWQSARDLLRELKRVEAGGAAPADSAPTIAPQHLALWQRPMPLTLGALLIAVVAGLAVWSLTPRLTQPVSRMVVSVAPSAPVGASVSYSDVAISPDGAHIIYQTEDDQALHVRAVDQLQGAPLRGAAPAGNAFVSPDGAWVGFTNGPALMKVSILGGAPLTICEVPGVDLRGASWGADDTIVFGVRSDTGLLQVPAAGGEPELLTTPDEGFSHRWPDILPGGSGVLFAVDPSGPGSTESQIAVLDLATGVHEIIIPRGLHPRYSSTGHIVYAVEGTLRAVAFDLDTLEVTSDPVPVVEGVMTKDGSGAASFDLSESGSLIYVGGTASQAMRSLVWVDREGGEEPLPLPSRGYFQPRLSPDGTRVAITVAEQDRRALWVYDVASGAGLRFTNEGAVSFPVWTPDGQHVVFTWAVAGENPGLHWVPADGRGPVESLAPPGDAGPDEATGVTPDGSMIVFSRRRGTEWREIWELPLEGERTPKPLVEGEFLRHLAAISPDANWLTYRSNQSGQNEIYVQPYPGPGPTIPVSIGGGNNAVWSPDGSEIFYRRGNAVMAVDVSIEGDVARVAAPRELFSSNVAGGGLEYQAAPDGRFLMLRSGDATLTDNQNLTQVVLVQNWHQELLERVPVP